MKEIKKEVRQSQHNQSISISVAILFILIIFISSMLIFANLKFQINETNNNITYKNNENVFNNIMDIRKTLEADTYNDLKIVASNIESDITSTVDLTDAEVSMNNGVIPEDVQTIIENNIRGLDFIGVTTDDNNIFVCNKRGIIADFSIKDATKLSKERTWQYETNEQYNKELSKETIESLLNESHDSLLVFEKDKSDLTDHTYYNIIDEETLKNIYMSEGIEGFKNYSFLIPVYITDDGDIFGKEDVLAGHIQNNNKFIIVQEYNLYDYIVKNNENILNESLNNYTYTQFSHIISYMNIFGISIICAIICVVLFLSVLSNKLFDVTNACMGAIDRDNKSRKKEIDKYYDHEEVVNIIEKNKKKE